jgi:chaperonin GroEL (HSP60 family)
VAGIGAQGPCARKLAGGVAIIKVGAATETEMREKKARVEDALHATRAAVEEGIVPGGGVALLRASVALDGLKLEGDEQFGVNIMRRACEEPSRQILSNSGTEGAIVVEKIKPHKDANFGFNATTEQNEDLVQAGVIDPTRVTARLCRMPLPSLRSCLRPRRRFARWLRRQMTPSGRGRRAFVTGPTWGGRVCSL